MNGITLPEGLATSLIHGDPDDWRWDADFDQAALDAFTAEFEHLGSRFLGDPKESWYQGASFTTVIRRKSDGALFGYGYWEVISKHGETYYEPNGEDGEYIFLPVRAFPITGYEILEEAE